MSETIIIKSIFIFIVMWGLSTVFLLIRPRIEMFWKVIALLIFIFYVWFFFDEVRSGFAAFTTNWYKTIIDFLKELITLVFGNLFFLWPLALIIIFYKADDMGAEKLLKFMCILTLVLWLVFIIYYYFNTGIDKFFYESLRKMVPNAK